MGVNPMATLRGDQIPDYVTNSEVRWTLTDINAQVTLNRTTGVYNVTYIEWNDEADDWINADSLSPAASLRLACEYKLVIPA
jgi:hypothetical protein